MYGIVSLIRKNAYVFRAVNWSSVVWLSFNWWSFMNWLEMPWIFNNNYESTKILIKSQSIHLRMEFWVGGWLGQWQFVPMKHTIITEGLLVWNRTCVVSSGCTCLYSICLADSCGGRKPWMHPWRLTYEDESTTLSVLVLSVRVCNCLPRSCRVLYAWSVVICYLPTVPFSRSLSSVCLLERLRPVYMCLAAQ